MRQQVRLCDLCPGHQAVIRRLPETGLRQRLLDMGFLENSPVSCVGKSPMGDPRAYLVRGAVIALRRADSAGILIEEQGAVWD